MVEALFWILVTSLGGAGVAMALLIFGLEREKREAWNRGYDAAMRDVLSDHEGIRSPNPYDSRRRSSNEQAD